MNDRFRTHVHTSAVVVVCGFCLWVSIVQIRIGWRLGLPLLVLAVAFLSVGLWFSRKRGV
jgi:NhaP-type Na+/H+ and K+/H+ antiporter